MSRRKGAPVWRRALPVVVTAGLLTALVGAGSAVEPEDPTFRQAAAPLVGRTSTTCPVSSSAQRSPGRTTVTAVVSRQAPGRPGRLTATPLTTRRAALTLTEQGRGGQFRNPKAPVVLRGAGVMATASSGAVVSTATEGPQSGLMTAPCTAPATSHWFPGIGAGKDQVTELVLTNPDDAQAEVNLRYYGPEGLVVVPGSPGLDVPARGSRTVPLAPTVAADGPLSVRVFATQGRVSATAREVFTDGTEPAGADWHPASVAPRRDVLIGAVPGGPGNRQLVVVNPGARRAEVAVSVLGVQGALAPTGADALAVEPESSVAVDLAPGLAEQPGAIQLASDRPVTAAVVSTSRRPPAQPDVAVQAALPSLVRTGVSAVAGLAGAESELVLSNGTDTDTPLSFEVLSLNGVVLRQEDVLVAARATATRRLESANPAYVVVRVPDGSQIHGGLALAQLEGRVAGLTTLGVLSPDVASRAPQTVADPSVGR